MIDSRMWDDPEFVALDRFSQLLWLYLLQGPEASESCPGLLRCGVASLAEALRASTDDVRESIGRLSELGWVAHYPELRLIHIPRAPAFRGRCNGNILRGWYKRWQRVPDCKARREHVALMAPCNPGKGDAWQQTFGSEAQAPRFPAKSTSEHPESLSPEPGTGAKGSPHLPALRRQAQDQEQDQEQDQDRDQDRDQEQEREPESLGSRRAELDQLWAQLNKHQAAVGARITPPSPGTEKLALAALNTFGLAELEHYLRVLRRKATENAGDRKWLDGVKTWHPNVIENNRGESAQPTARDNTVGHARATDDPSAFQGGHDPTF